MGKNGRALRSKITKHINARYFFIKDYTDKGDMEVEYFPTEKMWSDVLNNPKQGKLFSKFRQDLMIVRIDCDDDTER